VNDTDVSCGTYIGYVDGATDNIDRMYDAFSDGGAAHLFNIV
jgi:hypothetical protein